ncbi:MAG: ribosome biogenesis GTP-binding protein YsxC [Elusimicrobia bacterium]|nr:ribosome biogenesis GTP-binding protein YsxC [Elusimicrobiota bacterium]
MKSEADPAKLGPCRAEIAFVGRSNVGKSSLLNALCGSEVARVSRTPGRTRTINVFLVGPERWLVDLPGYGFARGPKEEVAGWGPMIDAYLALRRGIRMVFALVDAEVGPTPLDLAMVRWLKYRNLPYRIVATKSDQVKPSRFEAQKRDVALALGVPPETISWVSSRSGAGIRALAGEASAILEKAP